jgi:hypothetical protein
MIYNSFVFPAVKMTGRAFSAFVDLEFLILLFDKLQSCRLCIG